METRQIRDAQDLETGQLIYIKGHAKATYMSDGRTVEDAINNASGGGSIDASNFPQYDNQQAITVQGINNGNGATYAIPGSDIMDGGEYDDVFALKSEIPDITGLATQANLTSAVTQLTTNIAKKQDKLVSGTNIATINNNSILGSGNFDLATSAQLRDYQPKLVSGTSIKTINGASILGSGDIEISGGGSSDANVQAVDTGDVLDDVNVEYVTKTYVDGLVTNYATISYVDSKVSNYATISYVDGLVGDINSVLESIINGGVTQNYNNIYYAVTMLGDSEGYNYFWSDYPVESDITITASYYHPTRGEMSDIFTISKGNTEINEMIEAANSYENITISPEQDSKYIYNFVKN